MTCLLPFESCTRKRHSWCQQVYFWRSWQRSKNWMEFWIIHLCFGICKPLRRVVVAGVVYNASLYGLGVEVCKAASSPSTDPKGNILLLSPLLSYIWTRFVSDELQILAVAQIQCSASEYLQPQTCLSCCQCITSVPRNLNLYLVQTKVHVVLASSHLLKVSTAFTDDLETVSIWVLSEISWLCSALAWHRSWFLGKVAWVNSSKLALAG